MPKEATEIEAGGRSVRLSSPSKVFFPKPGFTKLDLATYYVEVADAACRHLAERPTTMKRFVDGVEGEFFFQKRVPKTAPDWLETATVKFPSGRSATELVGNDAAHLVWAVNLGVVDFNPWPARRDDLDHPDELRVDLDPTPEVGFEEVRQVALMVREVLADHGARRLPEDLGIARHPRLRAGRAAAGPSPRCAARRWRWRARSSAACRSSPPRSGGRRSATASSSTTTRTPATARSPRAYSVRPVADARVSTPARVGRGARRRSGRAAPRHRARRASKERGDPSATIDDEHFSLEPLLELADRDEAEGLGDAPWPPHFAKQKGEPKRVQPSRAKKA